MVPVISLMLWLVVVMIKMTKTPRAIKEDHPEIGKGELYQVIGRL